LLVFTGNNGSIFFIIFSDIICFMRVLFFVRNKL
jgi:hypothetical protein